jgi:hypothetical protein
LSNAVAAEMDGIAADIAVADLFGIEFLQQIDSPHGQQSQTLTHAFLVVAIAYSMAVTGIGDSATFLSLKEELLRYVLHDIQERSGSASLQALGVMLLLGSPLVCLLSHKLPGSLRLDAYLTASTDSDNLCCTDSAARAKESLQESAIHWRELTRQLALEEDRKCQGGQLSWLTYLSRYLQLYASPRTL